jgi:hypothetical protein
VASKFKVTLVFEAGSRGWTESYIFSSAGDSHAPVEGPATRLANARIELCGQGARIKAIRISKEGIGPDSLLRYTDIKPTVVKVPDAQGNVLSFGPRAQPNVALLVRCSDVTEAKRKYIYLRGIPDLIEVNGGMIEDNKIYAALFDKFRKQLINESWGWSGVATKYGPADLLNYESTVNGVITFTLQANLFQNADFGKRVMARFRGVNGKSQLNGPQLVKVTDAQSGKLVYPLSLLAYKNGGQVSYSTLDFQKIEIVDPHKVVTRKAGAPLLESRGRAKAKPRV